MPSSVGRENLVVHYGLEPYRYSDLELSPVYKTSPHTCAADINWLPRGGSNSRRWAQEARLCPPPRQFWRPE